METKITWEELDYLEASRYAALNWTEEEIKNIDIHVRKGQSLYRMF